MTSRFLGRLQRLIVLCTLLHSPQAYAQYEQGFTFRLYDIQENMDKIYPLVEGQTPNVDSKDTVVDYESTASFKGFQNQFYVEISGRIEASVAGEYEFRLTSDDGSILSINDAVVIDHDGLHAAEPKDGSVVLTAGPHPFEIQYFESGGGQRLLLEWKEPGQSAFTLVPANAFSTLSNVTRVTAPGKKNIIVPGGGIRPGRGQPLQGANPGWTIHTIRPDGFEPKVGALAFHSDGRLFVSTFEPNQFGYPEPGPGGDGKIYALSNVGQNDRSLITATEVASGLSEPLGMEFIDGDLYVSQRLELTRLKDTNNDGFYETKEVVTNGWEADNFHHFHFGLIEKDGWAYSTLSTTVNRSGDFDNPQDHSGLNGSNPPNRGTLLRSHIETGAKEFLAGGLRTPNGICFGPENTIVNCDNQGGWLPSSKLQVLEQGKFYGFYNATNLINSNYPQGGASSLFADQPVTAPAIWLAHNEVANSPSEPIVLQGGIFNDDILFGEVTLGGVRRATLEKVKGVWQGCAYRFSQGFEGGINRVVQGPDGSIYVGCIGATSNWSWRGTTFGLQRLTPKTDGTVAFELKEVRALHDGFMVEFTKPITSVEAETTSNYLVKQWTYTPTSEYGGPKEDEADLNITSAELMLDGKTVRLKVDGMKEGYVHHIRSDVPSTQNEELWSTEAWYTLNQIPDEITVEISNLTLSGNTILENQPAGSLVGNLSASHPNSTVTLSYSLLPNTLDNELFTIEANQLLSAQPFDFEYQNSYQIIVRASSSNGESLDVLFNIQVTDQGQETPPHDILLSSHILAAPNSAGMAVGTLSTKDFDLGDLEGYELSVSDPEAIPELIDSLLVQENFDYSEGSLITQNQGKGFSGGWRNVSGNNTTTGAGFATQPAANARVVRDLDLSPSGPLSNYLDSSNNVGANGTTLYISYRQQLTQADLSHSGIFEFRRNGDQDGNTQFATGVDLSPTPPNYGLRIKRNASLTIDVPGGPSAEDHRMVIKLEFGASGIDTISFYRDPAIDDEASPIGSIQSSDLSFDRLGFGSFQQGGLRVADIRIGETFSDVVSGANQTSGPFSLVSGDGDDNNALFSIQGHTLSARGSITPGIYSVRVEAIDSAGLTFQKPLSIYVGNGQLDDDDDGLTNAE